MSAGIDVSVTVHVTEGSLWLSISQDDVSKTVCK